MAWHTPATARALWADAPPEPIEGDPDPLTDLLESARVAVLAYAPPIADVENPPAHYRAAQLMQLKNTWNTEYASPSGDFDGAGGFGLTAFPLERSVKQLLRPRTVFGGAVG